MHKEVRGITKLFFLVTPVKFYKYYLKQFSVYSMGNEIFIKTI